jgi:hypothetical protein
MRPGKSRFRRPHAALLLAAVLSVALLAGCAGSSPSAESQLCRSADSVQDAASQVRSLGPDSTLAEVRQAINNLLVGVRNVAGDAAGVVQSDLSGIQQSFDNFSAQMSRLPDNATAAEMVAALQQALPALRAAMQEVLSGVDCGGTALGLEVR